MTDIVTKYVENILTGQTVQGTIGDTAMHMVSVNTSYKIKYLTR